MWLAFSILVSVLATLLFLQVRTNLRLKEFLELQTYKLRESRRLLRMRARLADELAHEIKNPLAAILCSAEALELLAGEKLDREELLSLKYIREYSDNLYQMLRDFLDLSAAENGNLSVKPENIDVVKLVNSVTGLLKSKATLKNIKFQLDTPEDKVLASADPRHIKQVIFNLLHNAIKFSPEAGLITISTGIVPKSNQIFIAVSDKGPGIEIGKLPRIFDPYQRYRGDEKESGSGIGLALCKQLSILSGGSIQVTSEQGQGSTFEIMLPNASLAPQQNLELSRSVQKDAFSGS